MKEICSEMFSINFRFVNLVASSDLDATELWKHVRSVRKDYYQRITEVEDWLNIGQLEWESRSRFVHLDDMATNFEILSALLDKTNVSTDILTLSEEEIRLGSEMFLNLNSAPPNYVKYFRYLFDDKPISEVILSTLNVMKNFRLVKYRLVAEDLLKKIATSLDFEYYQVNHLMKWMKSIPSVKGWIFDSFFCFHVI